MVMTVMTVTKMMVVMAIGMTTTATNIVMLSCSDSDVDLMLMVNDLFSPWAACSQTMGETSNVGCGRDTG